MRASLFMSTAALTILGSLQAFAQDNSNLFSTFRATGTMQAASYKNLAIAPGATATILPTVSGSGYISELFAATNQYNTQITITVDGESTPSINTSLGEFLGDPYLDSQAAFFGKWISGSNYGPGNLGGTVKIPIPFSSSVTVQLTNNSSSTAIITSHIIYQTGVPDSWAFTQRLHVAVVNAQGIPSGGETNMLNVAPGKPGKLFGYSWIYDAYPGGANPTTAGLEGSFKMYVDGSTTPNYMTGGSEDEFGMPWYFNHVTQLGPSQALAIASTDVVATVMNPGWTWGAQRFFVNDPINFNKALRFTWTCGNPTVPQHLVSGTCTLRSTVYYYTQN